MENPPQSCEYCEASFVPKVRFRQKYCSKSCKVLYHRHQCTRKEYEAQKASATTQPLSNIPPQPNTEAQKFLGLFVREYVGEHYAPSTLKKRNLTSKLEKILAQELMPSERAWLTEINELVAEVSQYTNQNKAVQLKLKPDTVKAIDVYLGNSK